MAFADALTDSITIYTISIGLKVGDSVGQEVKTSALLYASVPGRLHTRSMSNISRTEIGKQETSRNSWTLLMKPEHNGANRGDRVVVNSQEYMIAKKQEVRGTTSAIHHVIYDLEEAK